MINREDMLELTRRMTPSRNCFTRLAGCYIDRHGEIDDTYNVNFLNLKMKDKTENLALIKEIPFSRTNDQLVRHRFPKEARGKGSFWQLLMGVCECGLKNDLLMELLYEQIAKNYDHIGPYGIFVVQGVYDVPAKASDDSYLDESEEVYSFIICGVCPANADYDMSKPEYGFLFPAFSGRSSDPTSIDIFDRERKYEQSDLTEAILGK